MAEPALDVTVEAILFVASEPLTVVKLASATGEPAAAVEAALGTLAARLTGGIQLAQAAGAYRLVTAPAAAAAVGRYTQDTNRSELTRPALETLAIVAYKGPLTKTGVERIRGVSSEAMLRNLTARGLITEAGRSSEPGRPQLYAVSHAFLQHFGLTGVADLPPLPESGGAAPGSASGPDTPKDAA